MVRRSGDNSVVTGVLLDSQTSTLYRLGLVWKYVLKGCRVGVAMMRSRGVQLAAKELVICLLVPCSLAPFILQYTLLTCTHSINGAVIIVCVLGGAMLHEKLECN